MAMSKVYNVQGSSEGVEAKANPDYTTLRMNSYVLPFELRLEGSEEGRGLTGIAVDSNLAHIYAVRSNFPTLKAYNLTDGDPVWSINIPGMTSARAIVYNGNDGFVYIANSNQKNQSSIYKVQPGDSKPTVEKEVKINDGEAYGLTITPKGELLVSMGNLGLIHWYSTDIEFLKSIVLNEAIQGLFSAIELRSGHLVLCQRQTRTEPNQFTAEHRILLINPKEPEQVINSYGKGHGSDPGQLLFPFEVDVDEKKNMIVVDSGNDKFKIFDGELKLLGPVNCTGQKIKTPTCFSWDCTEGRLFVGDSKGRMSVIQQKWDLPCPATS